MPPTRKNARGPAGWSNSLPLSSSWGMAYKALAAAALVLLVGAVCQGSLGDSAGASLLFELGLATQITAAICFVVAATAARKH